ncbi:MAG: helix-turn-helix domain-containing protein [Acidocella sp.]|nr:helix-turn-helix domain-containing protein [Acidocella sp.]
MQHQKVKQISNWPVLDQATKVIADGKQLPPSIFTAIADRLRTAIEAPDAARVQTAAELLERFYREAVAKAPVAVQAASRGEDSSDLATTYALGKFAFAQLLAARIADTRADGRFIDHIRDERYLPYIQALFAAPLNVSALSEKTGKRIETVSRKLVVLRGLGIVTARKHGNVVVNMLTPAAVATLEELGLSPAQEVASVIRASGARSEIERRQIMLSPHMRKIQKFSSNCGGHYGRQNAA